MSRLYWTYSLMLVAAAFLASVSGCPSLFRLPPTRTHLALSLVAAGLLILLAVVGSKALVRFKWYADMAALLKRLMSRDEMLGRNLDTSRALPIALYSSMGEEAFFRGWLQPWLILQGASWLGVGPDDVGATLLGVGLASLSFGLVHFPVLKVLRPWTAFAVVAGLGFGLLAAFSGSLLPSFLAHFLINWLNLRWLATSELEAASLEELFGGQGPSQGQ